MTVINIYYDDNYIGTAANYKSAITFLIDHEYITSDTGISHLSPKFELKEVEVFNANKYIIGERYYASNPLAGPNMQSGGELIGWTMDGMAKLYNARYGVFYATINNLNEHN